MESSIFNNVDFWIFILLKDKYSVYVDDVFVKPSSYEEYVDELECRRVIPFTIKHNGDLYKKGGLLIKSKYFEMSKLIEVITIQKENSMEGATIISSDDIMKSKVLTNDEKEELILAIL
jgi:hypothetical protein